MAFGSGDDVTYVAIAPGFDSRSRRYDFRDWLTPGSKSQYG